MNELFSLIATIVVPVGIFFFSAVFVVRQYKRCPSNKILVVYGRISGAGAAKCIHGGGQLVIPLFQDFAYLPLNPIAIDIDLQGALSKKNIRVNVPSTFTIGISTRANVMTNAAERLLGLEDRQIAGQARDIILGQMRLVIATLSIEEINQDREKFLDLVNKNVGMELNKIGLEVINVNIRDITDESGYIEAIGKNAAAEAINRARVEVAEQDKSGAIGEASANREKEVEVANQNAQTQMGASKANRDQQVTVAKYEAEGAAGTATAAREQEIAIAEQKALSTQGQKEAERSQRVAVAKLEAEAIEGENNSRAKIAVANAQLYEQEADAKRRGEVARAAAERDVLRAQKEQMVAQLERDQIAQEEIDKRRAEIEAEAAAEKIRRVARGEADAILAKYEAEADGINKVLAAKAQGYGLLLETCGDRRDLAPVLLMIEKLPEMIEQQVKAIQDLKIEKITVWDSGGPDGGTTAKFLRSLIGSLPAMHDLAKQAGIKLPDFLGDLKVDPTVQA